MRARGAAKVEGDELELGLGRDDGVGGGTICACTIAAPARAAARPGPGPAPPPARRRGARPPARPPAPAAPPRMAKHLLLLITAWSSQAAGEPCRHTVVVYNRVPKAASSSVLWILQERARTERRLDVLTDATFDRKGALASPDLRDEAIANVTRRVVGALQAHAHEDATVVYERHTRVLDPVELKKRIGDATGSSCTLNVAYMNVVRDPVERALSRYAWDRSGDRPTAAKALPSPISSLCPPCPMNMSAASCLDRLATSACSSELTRSERLRRIIGDDELQASFFCDASFQQCDFAADDDLVETRLAHVETNVARAYAAVGVVELWDDTLAYFAERVPGGVFEWASASQHAWARQARISPLGTSVSPTTRRSSLDRSQLRTLLGLLGRSELQFYRARVRALASSRRPEAREL